MSQRLKSSLNNFYNAWLGLTQAWEDAGNIDCPDYPFNQSFDEIPVKQWVDSFKEAIDKSNHNVEMAFITERPILYDEINNFYLRSDFEDEESEPCIFVHFKACGNVGNRPSENVDETHEDDTWAIDRYDEDGEILLQSYLYTSEAEYLEDCKILGLVK